MQTCRGNWRAPNLFSRLVRDPRVFFHPVELSIQALGPLSNRFQRARVCLGCSDSGRFNYSSPRPLHTRFSSFVYSFCRTRRKPRRIPPSMFFLSFLSPSSSLFPLAVEVTQDQPRETCSLPSFLSFSLSLSGETVSSSVPSYSPGSLFCSSLLYSLPRDNQIIRVVPLMKNTSNLLDEKILHRT